MKIRVSRSFLASTLGALLLSSAPAFAADHGDSPIVRLGNQQRDINDVYIFQSPANPANTVMIMTTNPAAGVLSPVTYATDTDYEFVIENTGDAVGDLAFRVNFGKPNASGDQSMTVTQRSLKKGKKTKLGSGVTHTPFNLSNGATVLAGTFDDPFFFDLIAFKEGLSFSSTNPVNFFHGLNTNAIVIELPSSALLGTNGTKIGIWCRTLVKNKQIDRMGRPAINTVLVKSARKDAFNAGQPQDDFANFGADAIAIIQSLGSTAATAQSLAQVLLPDIMTFDTANAGGFLNGRKLTDDVIDAELNLLSSGGVTSDFVNNDSTFSNTFPYLGVKNP